MGCPAPDVLGANHVETKGGERAADRSPVVEGAFQLLVRTKVVIPVEADDAGALALGERRFRHNLETEDRCQDGDYQSQHSIGSPEMPSATAENNLLRSAHTALDGFNCIRSLPQSGGASTTRRSPLALRAAEGRVGRLCRAVQLLVSLNRTLALASMSSLRSRQMSFGIPTGWCWSHRDRSRLPVALT
jgi:hypothetical protein